MVAPAVASTLGLLRDRWTLSQTRLLGEREFEREAEKRGLRLRPGQLEQFHRRGLLVPLLRVWPSRVAPPIRTDSKARSHTGEWQVRRAAAEGRVTDPAQHAFRRWPRNAHDRDVRYSEYQLLAVRQLRDLAAGFQGRRVGDDIEWTLPRASVEVQEVMTQSRNLAVALELLASRYRPQVLATLRSPSDDLYSHVDGIEPMPEWRRLAAKPDVVLSQAEHLLRTADWFDPLGKWGRVARIGAPSKWGDLRFDALIAMDFRIAAEHLLLFREDLAACGRAPELKPVSTEWREARHSRLVVDARERAETLLDFRLSETPAVVVALEGETEMQLAPRVLALMGVEERQGLIQFVNLKGVGGDVRLLGRALAVPLLDPNGFRGARVLRRLTALVIAVDAEHGYATPELCERKRQEVVDEILGSVPSEVRTPKMRSDLEHLVVVRTWGDGGPFEFSHFSDAELARGIRSLARTASPPVVELTGRVARHRAGDRNVESIWRKWRSVTITKPMLADALWPVLERRLVSRHSRRRVPIGEILEEAVQLAQHVSVVRELRVTDEE